MKVGVSGMLVWKLGPPGDESRGSDVYGHNFMLDVPGVDNVYDAIERIEAALAAAFPKQEAPETGGEKRQVVKGR